MQLTNSLINTTSAIGLILILQLSVTEYVLLSFNFLFRQRQFLETFLAHCSAPVSTVITPHYVIRVRISVCFGKRSCNEELDR